MRSWSSTATTASWVRWSTSVSWTSSRAVRTVLTPRNRRWRDWKLRRSKAAARGGGALGGGGGGGGRGRVLRLEGAQDEPALIASGEGEDRHGGHRPPGGAGRAGSGEDQPAGAG